MSDSETVFTPDPKLERLIDGQIERWEGYCVELRKQIAQAERMVELCKQLKTDPGAVWREIVS